MKKRRNRRRGRMKSALDITNLVDVIFALLIIFMITAPMMTQGVQVDLPQAEAKNVESDHEMIQVSITDENRIFINEVEVSEREFTRRFLEEFGGRKEIPVFVNGDKEVPYGMVIRIITKIQKAGAVKLGFLTEPIPSE